MQSKPGPRLALVAGIRALIILDLRFWIAGWEEIRDWGLEIELTTDFTDYTDYLSIVKSVFIRVIRG
jgi:hypothetical protein